MTPANISLPDLKEPIEVGEDHIKEFREGVRKFTLADTIGSTAL